MRLKQQVAGLGCTGSNQEYLFLLVQAVDEPWLRQQAPKRIRVVGPDNVQFRQQKEISVTWRRADQAHHLPRKVPGWQEYPSPQTCHPER